MKEGLFLKKYFNFNNIDIYHSKKNINIIRFCILSLEFFSFLVIATQHFIT